MSAFLIAFLKAMAIIWGVIGGIVLISAVPDILKRYPWLGFIGLTVIISAIIAALAVYVHPQLIS